jgi:hypothetical protein
MRAGITRSSSFGPEEWSGRADIFSKDWVVLCLEDEGYEEGEDDAVQSERLNQPYP